MCKEILSTRNPGALWSMGIEINHNGDTLLVQTPTLKQVETDQYGDYRWPFLNTSCCEFGYEDDVVDISSEWEFNKLNSISSQFR